jgi:hypothetical protein
MDKGTLILIINGLMAIIIGLISFIINQMLSEIKLLRQRVHDALNHIAGIEAMLNMRKTDRMTAYDGTKDSRHKK